MPGRILGFDFGSTLPRPVPEKTRSSTSVRSASDSDNMDHLKRPHFGGKNPSNDKKDKAIEKRDSSVNRQPRHVKVDMVVESPPAMFIDNPQLSSGALYSGRLQLHVAHSSTTIKKFTLVLRATTTTKRPVGDRCKDCESKSSELKEWSFVGEPTKFAPGVHDFPFSYLLPGHLPTTTDGNIGKIDYSLHARAVPVDGEVAEYTRPIKITRAIRPGAEKNSVRIFPPTNLTLNVTLPSIVHPIGDFPIYARMSGITQKKEDTQIRWRLRKLTWRIEEVESMVSPACSKHAAKVGGEGRGVQHENVREIGMDEMKQGWKTDFEDGQIEGEFTASIDSGLKPQCDVESPSGVKINHVLILELVIAEEWAPNKKPNQATPTGAARVLRTQFNIVVTERAGMGIAWDDEQPPLYEDVPASPPSYNVQVRDITIPELNEDIDNLNI